MRPNSALMLAVALLIPTFTRAMDCGDVASSKPGDLVQFLKTQGQDADPDCVSRAIVRLGESRTGLGIDVLIGLLDFRRPETAGEKLGLFDLHSKFPAVSALFLAGVPAVAPLLAKLSGGEISTTARTNAIHTIVLIYRDDPPQAIKAFLGAANRAESQVEAVRLESCARDAVSFCGKDWRGRCEAALKVN